MATWIGPPEPEFNRPTPLEWARILFRGILFILFIVVLMICFWIARAIEAVVGGRRLSNFIIWLACVISCWVLGVKVERVGTPMLQGGARVCNHSSWMDIFVLRAASQIFFVAKSEVRSWPVLGFIAAQTGTLFIARKRTEAKRQEAMFAKRLSSGDRLCFFPEGTSSDGLRVLPFKSSLFNVFLTDALREEMWVQPVTLFYEPAAHLENAFYGWWGNIGFGPHVLNVFGKSRGGVAKVVFHDAVRAADFPDRKSLAAYCEGKVRSAHEAEISRTGVQVPEAVSELTA